MQSVLAIQLDLTNACNLRCLHCYLPGHQNDGALSLNDWAEVLINYSSLLNKLGMRPFITLCGGEPTLSSKLFPVLDLLVNGFSNPEVAILTNGTRIQPGAFEKYRRSLRLYFQVSLDGPDAETNDKIRGSGSFKAALEGLDNLVSEGHTTSILAVLSRRTSGMIPRFFELARARGVSAMNFTRLINQGHAPGLVEQGMDRPLTADELKRAYLEIVKISEMMGVPTATNSPLYCLIDAKKGASGMWGYQGLVVDYQGYLKVSSRVGIRLGNVKEHSLQRLFLENPLLIALRAGDISSCKGCAYKPVCSGDRNAAYAHSGDFLGRDPGCWKLAESEMDV